jgi:predicted ferric reductase
MLMKNMTYDMKRRIAYAVFALALVAPLLMWLNIQPLEMRVGDMSRITKSIGQLTGLWGLILFSMVLMLSTRAHILDQWFRGINEVYNYHHQLGIGAFLLILVHPFFLMVQYLAISNAAAAAFLIPGGGLAKDLGIYALLGMAAVLVVTLFARVMYQLKLATHSLFGLIFVLASAHALMIPSDITNDLLLRSYMLVWILLGVCAYIYRSVYVRFFDRGYVYEIEDVLVKNDTVCEIVLKPVYTSISYTPGQFVFVSFKSQYVSSETHPFSLSSTNGDTISLTVKKLGDYTQTLGALQKGDRARIQGPYGSFSYTKGDAPKQVWIAGGIGITPFLSMVRDLASNASERTSVDLYYSVQKASDLVYLSEIENAARDSESLRVFTHISEQEGFLTVNDIIERSGIIDTEFFICGPGPMMGSLQRQLISHNVNSQCIHTEAFVLL